MKGSNKMTKMKKIVCDVARVAASALAALALVPATATASEVAMIIDAGGATADFSFKANASSRELLFGYGTTDAGTDTNAWANVVKLADVPAGATSLSDVALPSGCGTTWTVARAFLPREVTSLDYVQRGLILQYDAKENAGRGLHDAAPSVWKDLVGTNDLPLVAADSAEVDAVLVSAGAHNTVGDIVGSYKPLMFEAYSKIVAFSGSSAYLPLVEIPNVGLIGFRNQQSAFFIRCAADKAAATRNSGQCYNDGYWNYDELKKSGKYRTMSAYLKWGAVTTARNCYANGSKISQKWYPSTSTNTMPSELNLAVGADGISNRFRSIRIYDRELTAAEVAFNRAVDVARYEGSAFSAAASELVYAPAPLVVVRTSTVDGGYVSADITFGVSPSVRRLYVAYARTDAGMATNLYDGCDYVCDIAAGTTSATISFPASASGYLAVRGGYRLALEKSATADDYVTSGLIVQYDAKENAGRGLHDAAPSVWKDLIGVNDLPFDSEDVVDANYVRISTNAHWTAGNVVDSYKPNMSFEAYKRLDSFTGGNNVNTHVGTIMAVPYVGELGYWGSSGIMETRTPQDNLSSGWRRVWSHGSWAIGEITAKWETWTAYLPKEQASTTASAKCYVNGNSKSQNTGIYGQITWPAATERRLQVGGKRGGAYSTVNSFRSIRIYDRKLTADEVAFNRKVDVARYEGGATPIFEWSAFVYVKRGMILFVR